MTAEERARCAVLAALLAQGERIDRLSRPLTLLALAALPALPLLPGSAAPMAALAVAVALAGLGEAWMAVRVGFDAALFRALGEGGPPGDLHGLDAALRELGLLPDGKAGRALAARLAGARRLLARQALLLGVQILLLAGGALLLRASAG